MRTRPPGSAASTPAKKEYNQALAKAQTLAAAGDFSGYKALGYTDAGDQEPQDCIRQGTARLCERNAERKQLFLRRRQQKGGTGNKDVYAGMYDAGIRSEGDAYAWLLTAGYNTTQAGKLADYYARVDEEQG